MKVLQPSSRDCFVCGVVNPSGLHLSFYQIGPGEVTAEYIVSPQYQGYPGVVHGGIVAAMLDETAGRSQMGVDHPRFMYTARLDISYRKPVPVGQPLRLVGKALDSRRHVARAVGYIYDQQGNLLAEAQALLIDIPEEKLAAVDMEGLGWRVYSDEERADLTPALDHAPHGENV
ncbi:MAG: PaaI family thioesterase [Anaerolineales bacterium]|nr:PaaI family thioesterase [Anaerolineales bacterium]